MFAWRCLLWDGQQRQGIKVGEAGGFVGGGYGETATEGQRDTGSEDRARDE